MTYTNENDFRIFGMRHGGNHIFITWIASMCSESVWHFNNMHYGRDPFYTRVGELNRDRVNNLVGRKLFKGVRSFKLGQCDDADRELVRQQKKKYIIINYEDQRIYKKQKEQNIGRSKNVFNVIIIRDIVNLFASRLFIRHEPSYIKNWPEQKPEYVDEDTWDKYAVFYARGYRKFSKDIDSYKSCVKEFIGETNYLSNKVCVSYNAWVVNARYREKIASRFNLRNSDRVIGSIPHSNLGNSRFDDYDKYKNNAGAMRVLDRWKYFKDNPLFWEILGRDNEAVELSNKIFGRIPKCPL